ncbi:helix-turn-helix transcriptional regulator [Trichocoleus sp. FACHB-90]|uniref:helix-turn-helix transcriptional regulator n=1 Tax=Cyanophyceae TaxID=3028117 RepID=UPI001684EBF2|nr:helix-turn-helix transcriptional regulator [Trichocoleus sp. FACHB-90]MBD1924785.1 helix-turn-helix transcriptional regulator [Trichocoleus sp. FACHB-90]
MNRQQFKETLEKLEPRKPRTVEVLRMVLAKCTDAEIAKSLGIHQGTVRKHIEKLYAAFGIKSEFEGDRRSKRGDLVALFTKYKPEWVNDCPLVATQEVSYEREQAKPDPIPHSISSSLKESETGKDLMSLATSMLEHLGFNKKFRVNRTSEYIGYRLWNNGEVSKHYQLILAQQPTYLSISIHQQFLRSEILTLSDYVFYWDDYDEYPILGSFWVLPSKEDVFLKSMQVQYPNFLKGEVAGSFTLRDYDSDGERWYSIVKQEFNIETLSDKNSYLIVQEDELFPYAGQVCISSRKVLEEFMDYFGRIIMER